MPNLTLPDAFLAGFGFGAGLVVFLVCLYRAIMADAERGF